MDFRMSIILHPNLITVFKISTYFPHNLNLGISFEFSNFSMYLSFFRTSTSYLECIFETYAVHEGPYNLTEPVEFRFSRYCMEWVLIQPYKL